jgi:hypothetical protein
MEWVPLFPCGRSGLTHPVRKEVIQPQVLLRLPCYDLVPVTKLAFGATLL